MTKGLMTGIDSSTLPPRPKPLTASDRAEFDRSFNASLEAYREKVERIAQEEERIELAKQLHFVLYEDLMAVTQAAEGTPQTRSAYKSDMAKFREWCVENGLDFLPTTPEIAAHYIVHAALSTPPARLHRIWNAIQYFHEWHHGGRLPDDLIVKAALRFARRCYEEEMAKPEGDREPIPTEEPEPTNSGGSGIH